MTLEQLTAFTISDDHKQQEQLWFESPYDDNYDQKGNLIFDGALVYAYDAENRLLAGGPASYAYDPLGRRTSKSVMGSAAPVWGSVNWNGFHWTAGTTASTFFISDGSDEIAEYSSAGALTTRYVPGPAIDEPIAMVTAAGTRTYFHANHQGSIIAMSDASGNRIEGPYTYDPYGNCFAAGVACSASGEPYRFTGRRFDPETGLYYYRARYYAPDDRRGGRFLQTDPVGYTADLNLYTYGANDPGDKSDPSGAEICGGTLLATASDSICGGTQDPNHPSGGAGGGLIGGRGGNSYTIVTTGGLSGGQQSSSDTNGDLQLAANTPNYPTIMTPNGPALQGTDPASLAARAAISGDTPLHRIGTTSISHAEEGQYWSLTVPDWKKADEYASKYGLPSENVGGANKIHFQETGTLRSGAPFITRIAPGSGTNGGGAVEVVVPPNGVTLRMFSIIATPQNPEEYGGEDLR